MAKKINKDRGKKILKADTPSSIKELIGSDKIVFSFLHFCRTQGASFRDWEDEGVLLNAIERFKEYSHKKVSQSDATYCIYGDFPPNTDFTHPQNVPQDARWARIHVNGNHIIAGHIVENVFYVVFLDSNHKFWIVEKKHT